MPDDLDDVAGPEDLDDIDEDALENLEDVAEDLDDDDLGPSVLGEDDDDDAVDVEVDSPVDEDILVPNAALVAEKSDDEEEDEEEPDDEDVEASLDVILKERLVVEDEPDDEEITDVEDRSEISERVLPKQPDEFVCSSCFLVKHPSQLADKKKMLCRDCV